jgi:hypothetical protein
MLKAGDLLGFNDMCAAEGRMLQQGMSFRTNQPHSILLMSQRENAPYPDRMSADGKTLYYIGHDAYGLKDKDRMDQPLGLPSGSLSQNGRFFQAALGVGRGIRRELVRVYEKLHPGVWVFNGLFDLVGAKMESDGKRKVCVFELRLVEGTVEIEDEDRDLVLSPGRLIPTSVKLTVLKRDRGRCAYPGCSATTNLHFDHILPYSKGGSSTNVDNVQLLCQRHNLEKSSNIV